MENCNKVTPPMGNDQINKALIIGGAQADLAAVNSILELFLDKYDQQENESLHGVTKLIRAVICDLEPLCFDQYKGGAL